MTYTERLANYLKDNQDNWARYYYTEDRHSKINESINSLIEHVSNDTLDNFDFDNNPEALRYYNDALSNIPLETIDKFKKGGRIRKAEWGDSTSDWYRLLYKQQELTGWNKDLDQSKMGAGLNTSLHHQYGTLEGAYNANQAYTSNKDLIGQDINTYYGEWKKTNPNGTFDNFIKNYKKIADKIRERWDRNDIKYNDTDAKLHNQYFKSLFANRSGNTGKDYDLGYSTDTEDIQGSTTWMRRMDRYETDWDLLTDALKKQRIHKVGDGYVYKRANGDIEALDNAEAERLLGLPDEVKPEVKPGEKPTGNAIARGEVPPQKQGAWGVIADNATKIINNLNPLSIENLVDASRTNKNILNESEKATVGIPQTYRITDQERTGFPTALDYAQAINEKKSAGDRSAQATSDLSLANATRLDADNPGELQDKMESAYETPIEASKQRIAELEHGNIERETATANEGRDRYIAHFNGQIDNKMQYLNLQFANRAAFRQELAYNLNKAKNKADNGKLQALQYRMDQMINDDPDVKNAVAKAKEAERAMYAAQREEAYATTAEEKEAAKQKYTLAEINYLDCYNQYEDLVSHINKQLLPIYYQEIAKINGYADYDPFAKQKLTKFYKHGGSVKKLMELKKGGNVSDDGPVRTRNKNADRFLKTRKHADSINLKSLDRLGRLKELHERRAIGK